MANTNPDQNSAYKVIYTTTSSVTVVGKSGKAVAQINGKNIAITVKDLGEDKDPRYKVVSYGNNESAVNGNKYPATSADGAYISAKNSNGTVQVQTKKAQAKAQEAAGTKILVGYNSDGTPIYADHDAIGTSKDIEPTAIKVTPHTKTVKDKKTGKTTKETDYYTILLSNGKTKKITKKQLEGSSSDKYLAQLDEYKKQANTSSGSATSTKNTNSTSTGTSTDNLVTEMFQMDDAFTLTFTDYETEKEYQDNLESGLTVSDIRGIFGVPHQFLPLADGRLIPSKSSDYSLMLSPERMGRTYTEKILKHIPLLLITPGTPAFMSSFSQSQKETILGTLITGVRDTIGLDGIFGDEGPGGKYYSLKYDYVNYFKYVNAMLRTAAMFLEIGDEEIDGRKLALIGYMITLIIHLTVTIYLLMVI